MLQTHPHQFVHSPARLGLSNPNSTPSPAKDASILAFANKLKEAERVLDLLVDDYADYRPRPKRTKLLDDDDDGEDSSSGATATVASTIDLSDILSYGHRMSYTTFAPPEFGAGKAPLRGALPPAPQDEQMRASQLYSFADLDIGVPETAEDKKAKTIEPLIEMQALFQVVFQMWSCHQDGNPGCLLYCQLISLECPLCYKAIYLYRHPDGRKPGDPVPLPPMSSAHAMPTAKGTSRIMDE